MEENENSGGECEKGNTVVESPVHVLTNGTNHLHQIENTLVAQKQLRNNNTENGIENDPVIIKPYTNGSDPVLMKPYSNGNDPVIIKPYTNGNGVHEENGKPYANGFAKKKIHNGCTEGKYSFEHHGDKPMYMNGNHVKVPDENCPDMIGDTIDTLKQYTTHIDKTLESLEQCQSELTQQLNNHNKTRTTTTTATTTTELNNHDSSKNENQHTNGNKNENLTKNENDTTEVNGDVSRNGGDESTTDGYLPMMNIDDEDEGEVFPTIPDVTADEDMLIQEKIMQSKSELVSKLNSQEQVTNLIINSQAELPNGHCTTTTTADGATCTETASSSAASSSENTDTVETGKKELTLFESCRQGHYETVKEILRTRKDVDVNMTDGDSWSCLHEVSIRNCQFTPIVELLLQNGADPNLRDKKGETPLHGAVLFHLVDTIKLLLQYNGDCNICNNTNVSPLKLATYLKDNEILQLFGHPVTEEKTSAKKEKEKEEAELG